MQFVNIEGLDGSGKSTQIKLLQRYFQEHQIPYQYIHFPRTDSPVYGELIAKFLRGDLGKMDTVDPYLIALLYAGDRNDAKSRINEWLNQDYLVLIDRYVYSNIAFQCAKLKDETEIKRLSDWIKYVEYEYFRIPKPDVEIFLDVPGGFTRKNLSKTRKGSDREYLQGKEDIHEKDFNFQEQVRSIYHRELEKEQNFHLIKCYNEQEQMYDPETIKGKILTLIDR